MRDPKRIKRILATVERRWEKHPDLRLCQLLMNVAQGSSVWLSNDLFNLEDDKLEQAFRETE